MTVLFAEQCKNVSVVQTPGTLYVFYDALVLAKLNASEPFSTDQPRVRLCPLHSVDCAAAARKFDKAGRKPLNICTYRTTRL